MQARLKLDGIVTLVDAKHVWQHIDDSDEVKEQIAFADVILLNKTDLVTPEELDKLERRIHSMNVAAKIYRTRDAAIDMDAVLNVGGFNLDRAMEVDPKFMEPEYPFEWGGLYSLKAGRYTLQLQPGPDPAMTMVLIPMPEGEKLENLEPLLMQAVLEFSAPAASKKSADLIAVGQPTELSLDGESLTFSIDIPHEGDYALFTEHRPEEFQAKLLDGSGYITPRFEKTFKPDHEHDEEVSSVGIDMVGDLDKRRFNQWLSHLLQTQGTDIFRMKGVISLAGEAKRYVFQGVHMLFDGRPDRPWGNHPRRNQLIFIGRNLDRAALNEGFAQCLA
jgi:G3E family GTPase